MGLNLLAFLEIDSLYYDQSFYIFLREILNSIILTIIIDFLYYYFTVKSSFDMMTKLECFLKNTLYSMISFQLFIILKKVNLLF